MALDVYTMDRLEGVRQETEKKAKQEERENNILSSIRQYRNDKIDAEKILAWIMNIFHLSHDEATAYLQKPQGKGAVVIYVTTNNTLPTGRGRRVDR